jgi:hypothetical protein
MDALVVLILAVGGLLALIPLTWAAVALWAIYRR